MRNKASTLAVVLLAFGGTELVAQDGGEKEPEVMEEIIVKDYQGDFTGMAAQFFDLDNWLWYIGWGPTLVDPGNAPPPIPRGTPPSGPGPEVDPCPNIEWALAEALSSGLETMDQIEIIQEKGLPLNEAGDGIYGTGKGIEFGPGSQLVKGVLDGLRDTLDEHEREFNELDKEYRDGDCAEDDGT